MTNHNPPPTGAAGEYQPDEIVDITIRGARVVRTGQDDIGCPFIEYTHGKYNTRASVDSDDPAVTVERVAPADWPPQPADVWGMGDSSRWFAQRYIADPDDKADFEGCNSDGWRVVLVPLDGGPYGSAEERPEELLQKLGSPTLLYREERAQQDGGRS